MVVKGASMHDSASGACLGVAHRQKSGNKASSLLLVASWELRLAYLIRMVYKVLIKKGNVIGVSKVKSNSVAEGVRLVKNLNVGGNIRKTMPTCSKMLMSSSFKCWTGSMTKRGKQVWQSKVLL
ncbi:hypothetical protein MTR67_008170 [Solanum verrucosum]|uniref:Uncharacterized protein n=1 Tax=Solanum verrucosum TaxID=315347 RepID=A0AAF0TIZ8_SOLVR|nr:hypothetical protein MTR67_008170 [Solanum verrucosum]